MEIGFKYIFTIKYLDKFIIKKIYYSISNIIINHVIDSLLQENLVTKNIIIK